MCVCYVQRARFAVMRIGTTIQLAIIISNVFESFNQNPRALL